MCGWLGKLKKHRNGGHVAWSVLNCYHSAPDLQMWTSISSEPVSFVAIIKICSFFLNSLLIGLLFSHSVVFDSLWPYGLQHARLPCPSLSPRAYSNPCPLSRWCHSTISSSVIPFSSCPQSFPSSGSFPVSLLFTSGGQSTGASASPSVLPVNIQGWFPLGLTVWSPCCPGNSQKSSPSPQFKSINSLAGTQPSLWSKSHIYIWLLEKS